MHANIEIPDSLGAAALDAALESLVGLAALDLSEAQVSGDDIPNIYESGVRWEREDRGSERWLVPSTVFGLGKGDCEDLSAWRTAELRMSGEDPYARARVIRSGPRTWHAIVERGDGEIEDPSLMLGMPELGAGPAGGWAGALADWGLHCQRLKDGSWFCSLRRGSQGVSGYGRYADDAIWEAATAGIVAGELGVVPGLDLIAKAAQGALSALLPGQAPARPAAPRAPVAAPRGPAEPARSDDSFDASVARIARDISRLTRREATRKLRDAQSKVR